MKIEVRSRHQGEVRITLRSVGVPHALPTGDPFRRFRVELCSDAGRVTAVEFGRRVAETGGGWMLTDDRTVPAGGERAIDVAAPGASRWRLLFEYAARGTESALEPAEREVELASGPVL